MPKISIPPSLRSHTFLTLDALRGIAALSVVIGHSSFTIGHPYFAHAYLAVDFFFMLSGFVLSYAYQQRLDDGLSTLTFMKARIIRLYPLYIAGTLAGFIYAFVTFLHSRAPGISEYFFHLFTALLFLPAPPTAGYPGMAAFPYNVFAWSMFYELLANVFHAVLLRRRSTRSILAATAIIGAILCSLIVRLGSNIFGILTRDLTFGLLRVAFSYLFGLLLFRLWSRRRDHTRLSPLWSALLLILTVSVPALHHHNNVFDIVALLLVMPTVVLMGALSQPAGVIQPLARLLGSVSYGIYILSMPIMLYTERAWEYFTKGSPSDAAPWSGLLIITTIFLTAWAANIVYDIPVRRWLSRQLPSRTPRTSLVVNSTQYSP